MAFAAPLLTAAATGLGTAATVIPAALSTVAGGIGAGLTGLLGTGAAAAGTGALGAAAAPALGAAAAAPALGAAAIPAIAPAIIPAGATSVATGLGVAPTAFAASPIAPFVGTPTSLMMPTLPTTMIPASATTGAAPVGILGSGSVPTGIGATPTAFTGTPIAPLPAHAPPLTTNLQQAFAQGGPPAYHPSATPGSPYAIQQTPAMGQPLMSKVAYAPPPINTPPNIFERGFDATTKWTKKHPFLTYAMAKAATTAPPPLKGAGALAPPRQVKPHMPVGSTGRMRKPGSSDQERMALMAEMQRRGLLG
jgi:hypothetical protein